MIILVNLFFNRFHLKNYISLSLLGLFSFLSIAQNAETEGDSIINVIAGYQRIIEDKYPGAIIYASSDSQEVYVEHNGIKMWCDQAIFYKKDNFLRALGKVRMNQGDSVFMNSKYAEYNGNTKLAFASGKVKMRSPDTHLETDTLYFDRTKQQAYYRSGGKVTDTASVLTSRVGRFFMQEKKYQFLDHVIITHPDYTINSAQVNFYTETGHAYLYGPSTIKGETSTVYCERGFYDTRKDYGHFVKNSRIDYNNRTVTGDSLFFNRVTNFASATNHIIVTDTINKSIIKGHYAEVYRDKDSVFITKRAVAISVQEQDSVYIHADTLMVTGPEDNRIIRGFKDVRLFKSDLSGRCDSIYTRQSTGLTKMIKKPVLWSGKSQITGDSIHLQSNVETERLDSLRVFYNAFVINKDTILDNAYDQIKGKELKGYFKDNELHKVKMDKNVENVLYVKDEDKELIGINKGTSSKLEVTFRNGDVAIIKPIMSSKDETIPPEEFPENARRLRGFNWREEEKLYSIDDLFKGKPIPQLTKIEGLPLPKIEDAFFDENNSSEINENSRLDKELLINKKEDQQVIGKKS